MPWSSSFFSRICKTKKFLNICFVLIFFLCFLALCSCVPVFFFSFRYSSTAFDHINSTRNFDTLLIRLASAWLNSWSVLDFSVLLLLRSSLLSIFLFILFVFGQLCGGWWQFCRCLMLNKRERKQGKPKKHWIPIKRHGGASPRLASPSILFFLFFDPYMSINDIPSDNAWPLRSPERKRKEETETRHFCLSFVRSFVHSFCVYSPRFCSF